MNRDKKRKMDEKEHMNENLLMPHLPEEIIIEILTRLPVRFLFKFMCVSKHWNPKLINMIKDHFSIMLLSGGDMYSIDKESVSPSTSILDVIDRRTEKIDCPVPVHFRKDGFVGCRNGLFCILTSEWNRFCLWNPSTGDYKEIPSPPDQFDKYRSTVGFGFGYDSRKDDYKVVRIARDSKSKQYLVGIYSLRSNSWKEVQHIPSYLFDSGYESVANGYEPELYGAFCNGALHWWSFSASRALIALHMTDENIVEISQPKNSDFKESGHYNRCIDVLDGCLCMLYCHKELGFEVWLMKDYGQKESWTKLYSISKLTSLDALYDPETDTSRVLKLDEDIWSSNTPSSFLTYVKSSVSVS